MAGNASEGSFENLSNHNMTGDGEDDNEPEVKSNKRWFFLPGLLFFISLSLLCILAIALLVGWKLVLSLKLSQVKSTQQALQTSLNKTFTKARSQIRLSENRRSVLKSFQSTIEVLRAKLNKLQVDVEDLKEVTHVSPGFPNLHSSCQDILSNDPFSSTGYYFIKTRFGQLRSVYCRMERCGSGGKPWTRVAYLNLDNCPPGTMSKVFHGLKTCVVERDDKGCTEIEYSVHKDTYSKICGKIRAYHVGTLDGIVVTDATDVNQLYVDGISVAVGNTHVWTLIAGDCIPDRIPRFVNGHWGCTRVDQVCFDFNRFCDRNILWEYPRHDDSNSHWFNRDSLSSLNNIKVKVCRDQIRYDEDIALKEIELYIR